MSQPRLSQMTSRASSIGRRSPVRTPGRSRAQSDAEAAPTPASQVAAEIIDKYDDFESSGDDDDLIDAPVVRKQAKPWQLQYQTPFVTCAHCNEINFFDADLLRQTMHTPELRVELERCTGCGQAIVYKAGADDLYDYVESKRRARIEAEKARRRATALLQRAYRGMVGRSIARQKRIERAEWLRQIKFAASEMQRIVRGRIGRKIARVNQALNRIFNAVPSVVAEALRMRSSDGKRRHVFWYKRPAEKELVYRDYRLFVDRTGNMPPLYVVEANFLELQKRIHTIESKAANVVQKVGTAPGWDACQYAAHTCDDVCVYQVFRGTISRMFTKELMMEKARLFSVRHTHVIILQRWWRECSAFRLVETMKYAQIPPQIMKVYKQYRFKQKEDLEFKHQHMKVKAHYRHEIKQARGAFMTGKCAYGSEGGKNLYAFSLSAYKSDTKKCSSLIKGLLAKRRRVIDRQTEQLARNAKHNRRVDRLLAKKPLLKRFDYLQKLPTVPPPVRKFDRVIEKDRICHFEQLATVIL